jgi:hypothetical protein
VARTGAAERRHGDGPVPAGPVTPTGHPEGRGFERVLASLATSLPPTAKEIEP